MRRPKKAMLWSIAEFWSWIAMFIIVLVFLLLFSFCSSPTIEKTQGARLDALKERQEALAVMRTPVVYGGQNLTIAYLIALGEAQADFVKVKPVIESALAGLSSYRKKDVLLQIAYAGRTETIRSDTRLVLDKWLDEVKVPSPGGTPITVKVGSLAVHGYGDVMI